MSTSIERAEVEVKRWSDLLAVAAAEDQTNVDKVALYERQLKDANDRLKEANAVHLASINQQPAAAPAGN